MGIGETIIAGLVIIAVALVLIVYLACKYGFVEIDKDKNNKK